ncbi:hypothetical protein PCANC_12478 [Puccinia coronata f. sp. avenae]|uniref:Uncharacterized protein n=1 Tax=Puccinia coronata f. sp. avenae TaxID=200324 RepID=A0A2N5UL59_9BASI|nr:hypothetical protein PCANC_12478 [Puccinia coronata f. sp. avenae]
MDIIAQDNSCLTASTAELSERASNAYVTNLQPSSALQCDSQTQTANPSKNGFVIASEKPSDPIMMRLSAAGTKSDNNAGFKTSEVQLGHIPRDVASETEEDIVTSNTSNQSISVATPSTPLIQPAPKQSNHQSIPSPLPENNAMHSVDSQDNIVQVINLAHPGSAEPPPTTKTSVAQPEAPTDQAPASSESTSAAPPAGSSQRVTIMIDGAEVDITNLEWILLDFLEALPDDMQEEVLNQHFREQQPVQEELSDPAPSSISTNFLNALPPKIQAEVICSKAGLNRAPADLEIDPIDPATFLAALGPSLREAVLLEQDNQFISTLPPNLIAEDCDDFQKLSGCAAFAVVQLLALAICNHTTDKLPSVSKLFISKPDLISQLSDLVNPQISGNGLGGDIQAAVFHALEEILQYCPPSSLVTFTLNMVTLVIIRINQPLLETSKHLIPSPIYICKEPFNLLLRPNAALKQRDDSAASSFVIGFQVREISSSQLHLITNLAKSLKRSRSDPPKEGCFATDELAKLDLITRPSISTTGATT